MDCLFAYLEHVCLLATIFIECIVELTIISKKRSKLKNTCASVRACMFNQFFKKFRSVCLIRSVCLSIYRKISLLYAYLEQTSIRDTRVIPNSNFSHRKFKRLPYIFTHFFVYYDLLTTWFPNLLTN